MKTTEEINEISQTLIKDSLTYMQSYAETIAIEIENECMYGLDSTGVLTKRARNRIKQLENEQRIVQRNITQLQLQLGVFMPKQQIPWRDEKDETVDIVRLLDQIEDEKKQDEKDKALKEITAARERGQPLTKDHEINR